MFRTIAYTLLFGKPLIMWGGMVTFLCFLFTAYISFSNAQGNHAVPFKWHKRMAILSLSIALFHGLLGILSNM